MTSTVPGVDNPWEQFADSIPHCPPGGKNTWPYRDPPTYDPAYDSKKPVTSRRLCIKVVVQSGCDGKTTTLQYSQWIKIVNNVPTIHVSGKPPTGNKYLDDFCK